MASLSGRRILEVGVYVAGPFAGHALAHLGADVIKVESPAGDATRTVLHGGPGGTYLAYGGGKRSLSVDLRSVEGQGVFERLLKTADVVLHNLAPDSARKLKISRDDCLRVNPHVVYCEISAYGPGPLENESASNPVVEAATGTMHGHTIGGRPMRFGPPYHDMFAGLYAVLGILAALDAGRSSQVSPHVQVGLYETALYVGAKDLVQAQLSAEDPVDRTGVTYSEFAHPGYGAYETKDGRWIYVVMLSDRHWIRFCNAMQLPHGDDQSLSTLAQRQEQRERVERIVRTAVANRSFDEAAKHLKSAGVAYTEVVRPEEVLNHPQAQHPGKVTTVQYQGREVVVPSFPTLSPMVLTALDRQPPLLGEHTLEILQSLGYDASECNELLARRAIAVPSNLE